MDTTELKGKPFNATKFFDDARPIAAEIKKQNRIENQIGWVCRLCFSVWPMNEEECPKCFD